VSALRSDPPAVADLAALVDVCTAADGVSPFGGHVLESVGLDADLGFVTAVEAGALVGLAVRPAADPAELAVSPAARGRGIGDQLLRSVLDAGSAVWAHGDLPAAKALAARHGLRITRELVQMRRSAAAPLPAPELPAGVSIRTFVPGADDAAFLAVNARAFSWHPEQGRLDQAGLDRELAQDWFDPAGFFLAVDADDRLLGYHWTKLHPTDPTPADPAAPTGTLGEIYVLGVDPESPVRGLGTPLSLAGLAYLRARGPAEVMLYVEGDNARALHLYERLGFTRFLTDVVYAR
jgi:mycothiol synthase